MKMDFDALNTFDDRAAALGQFLDAAIASVRSGDIASRIESGVKNSTATATGDFAQDS